MKQGSEEWHEMRRNHIGASDAPIIMKMSPWRKPLDLWREKVGLHSPRKTTGPMLYGKQEESQALAYFNKITEQEFGPVVVVHASISFMMASIDGYCEDLNEAVEIKCPGKKDHALAINGEVPLKYKAQLQHQIEVLGLDWIWYCSYSRDMQAYFKVPRDQEFIDVMIEEERKFWECVLNFEEPS